MLIHIGPHSIDAARYVRAKRADRDGVPRLQVFLDGPRDVVTVTGHDDVEAAVEEIRMAMAELDRARLGGGWVTAGGWDDDG